MISKRRLVIFLTPVAAILLWLGINGYKATRSPNVILITMDTLRRDYLSCYDAKAPATPNIDSIAKKGIIFTNAYTLIPITLPSHASILTSYPPHKLGIFNNGERYVKKVPSIAQVLKKQGYSTAAFVSLGVLQSNFGLSQGFDAYEDNFEGTNGRPYKTASEINELVLPWLERNRTHKFFAWIHYSDPHGPYVTADAPADTELLVNDSAVARFCLAKQEKIRLRLAAAPGVTSIEIRSLTRGAIKSRPDAHWGPYLQDKLSVSTAGATISFGAGWYCHQIGSGAKYCFFDKTATLSVLNSSNTKSDLMIEFSGGVRENRGAVLRANYASEVRYMDHHIGILWRKLESMKLADKTVVLLTSDHGEGLLNHGNLGHVDKLWNEIIRIPLIIYDPETDRRGTSNDALVNLLDVAPTVVDLLNVKTKSAMQGRSLKAAIRPRLFASKQPTSRNWTFAYTFQPEATRNSYSLTNGRIKLIVVPELDHWEAYDLTKDDAERSNLFHSSGTSVKMSETRKILQDYGKESEQAWTRRSSEKPTEEEKEMLEALGYVGN